jgi:membrane protease YdiL (CAAX protease family)
MSSSAGITTPNTSEGPVAPWWHTVIVLVPIGVGSVASAYQHGLPNLELPGLSLRLSGYLTVLAEEWFVVLLVWLALRRRGRSLGSLISGRWNTAGAFLRDLGLSVAFIIVTVPAVGVLAHFLSNDANRALAGMTPKTVSELIVFLALAVTGGGFCEELIFRGYLMRQFSAWTGNRLVGVGLQGVAFGLAHGYYLRTIPVVMLLGWFLGLLAYWRKSLRPGMLAHGLQDTLGGLVGFFS